MSNQQQQTAEKSVQTHDAAGSSTVLLTNHPENAATEVANTLVSMATGRQRGTTTIKQFVKTLRKIFSHNLSDFVEECEQYTHPNSYIHFAANSIPRGLYNLSWCSNRHCVS